MGQLAAQLNEISIHALLAESDRKRCQSRPDSRNFYPRSPCGERLTTLTTSRRTEQFLSTLSLRRATLTQLVTVSHVSISIHALLAESDMALALCFYLCWYFYPRSPCGERPWHLHCVFIFAGISIHALLAESDEPSKYLVHGLHLFLSTLSLRRATSKPRALKSRRMVFLSTLSLRRATSSIEEVSKYVVISIHALLAESDLATRKSYNVCGNFYPRSPCGERPDSLFFWDRRKRISIHALLAESDRNIANGERKEYISIHALLAESDIPNSGTFRSTHISIHALLAESDTTGPPCVTLFNGFLSTLSLRRATPGRI